MLWIMRSPGAGQLSGKFNVKSLFPLKPKVERRGSNG